MSTLTASIRRGTQGPTCAIAHAVQDAPRKGTARTRPSGTVRGCAQLPRREASLGRGRGQWSLLTVGASTSDLLGKTRDHTTRSLFCLLRTKSSLPWVYTEFKNQDPSSAGGRIPIKTPSLHWCTDPSQQMHQLSGQCLVQGLPDHEGQVGLVVPVSAASGHSCPCLWAHPPDGVPARSCHCPQPTAGGLSSCAPAPGMREAGE